MTKIGIISDTHFSESATDQIPQAVLDALRKVDMIIHCGDMVGMHILKKLQETNPRVVAVRGNMDQPEVKKALPDKELLKVGKFKIGIAHGYGSPANLIETLKNIFAEDKPDLIIFGHSHTPFNEKIGDVLFFNPGSPTDKMFSPYNSYGIIEINDSINAKIIRI